MTTVKWCPSSPRPPLPVIIYPGELKLSHDLDKCVTLTLILTQVMEPTDSPYQETWI